MEENKYEEIIRRYTNFQLLCEEVIVEEEESVIYNKKKALREERKRRVRSCGNTSDDNGKIRKW